VDASQARGIVSSLTLTAAGGVKDLYDGIGQWQNDGLQLSPEDAQQLHVVLKIQRHPSLVIAKAVGCEKDATIRGG
jgi:hypothetical protein